VTAGKLVRDRIPDIIRASGETPQTRVAADDAEYQTYLDRKLVEEVGEWLRDKDLGELADISETLRAIASARGSTPAEVERLRVEKKRDRGGFDARIVWMGNVA
jgi:predicted house-cleaning noncanonical NTP pyrophosphatase (MazG superfamily)